MEKDYVEIMKKIKPELEIYLKIDEKRIVDSRLAEILKIIDKKGSLLAACRETGFPYSRAWEWIMKLEKVLGLKIVEAKRGGARRGGMKLTEAGKTLLRKYMEAAIKYKRIEAKGIGTIKAKLPELAFMGSHDPLVEIIIEKLEKAGLKDVEISWIGSAGGLASLMIGDADVAGVHLLDPETGKYNVTYLPKYWLENKVVVYRGYMRELGFVYRKGFKIKSFLDVIEKDLRFINRNTGSGTRILIDYLIEKLAAKKERKKAYITVLIKGYDNEVKTHTEVCRRIAEGKADVGVALRYVAELYGLSFTSITWEWYDFVVSKGSLNREAVKTFINVIEEQLDELIQGMVGYKTTKESGEILVS